MDAVSPNDRLKLEVARSIREDFLHQNAFSDVDTYTSLKKQHLMMNLILNFYDISSKTLAEGAKINDIVNIPSRENIGRFKYVPENEIEKSYNDIIEMIKKDCAECLTRKEAF